MNTTEQKQQHTPGPWKKSHDGESCHTVIADDPDDGFSLRIATCPGPKGEANARLIAAAPQLLQALQAFVAAEDEASAANPLRDENSPNHPIQRAWLQARAVIRKATEAA